MEIFGLFEKEVWRDEKTGMACIILISDGIRVYCKGYIQKIKCKIPLLVSGKYTTSPKGFKSFNFDSYSLKSKSEADEIALLTSLNIDGLTARIAENIINTFNGSFIENALAFGSKKSFVSMYPQKYQEYVSKAYQKIIKIDDEKKLFFTVATAGGFYVNAMNIIKHYGASSFDKLKQNPYMVGFYSKMPFSACENLAYNLGFSSICPERATGILYYAMQLSLKNGDCYITKVELEKYCRQLTKHSAYSSNNVYMQGNIDFLYIWSKAVLDSNFIIKDDTISWRKIYTDEQNVANNIKRINLSSSTLNFSQENVKNLERQCKITLSDSQRNATNALKTSGVKIITGGPGVGKTTLINLLIKYCETYYPDRGIVLSAPTGCASQNMALKTGRVAETFHRTFGIKPFTSKGFEEQNIVTKKRNEKIYIFDEFSMADLSTSVFLFDSIPNDSIVLLVGDIDQLPSVSAGNVLHDLINSGIETYKLEGSFRQSKDSTIVANAAKIKNGQVDLLKAGDFQILQLDDSSELNNKCIELFKQTNCQVLVPTRKFNNGTYNLNKLLQSNRQLNKSVFKLYGNNVFYIGDKVITTDNNYSVGYFNGEPGYIVDIDDYGIEIDFGNMKRLYIENNNLDDVELAYAMTIHKSQGAEYETVVILLNKDASIMMNKNLLYTAVTRAKKNVYIVSDNTMLNKAITTNQKERNSHLLEFLSA